MATVTMSLRWFANHNETSIWRARKLRFFLFPGWAQSGPWSWFRLFRCNARMTPQMNLTELDWCCWQNEKSCEQKYFVGVKPREDWTLKSKTYSNLYWTKVNRKFWVLWVFVLFIILYLQLYKVVFIKGVRIWEPEQPKADVSIWN